MKSNGLRKGHTNCLCWKLFIYYINSLPSLKEAQPLEDKGFALKDFEVWLLCLECKRSTEVSEVMFLQVQIFVWQDSIFRQ